MKEVTLIVVRLSDAFTEVWTELAGEFGVDLRVPGSDDAWAPGPEVAAVIVAAGGAEREALEWMESQAPETEVPYIAVGVETNHRTAAQLVGAGASDYFALPQDIEVLRSSVKVAVESRKAALRRLVSKPSARRRRSPDGHVTSTCERRKNFTKRLASIRRFSNRGNSRISSPSTAPADPVSCPRESRLFPSNTDVRGHPPFPPKKL